MLDAVVILWNKVEAKREKKLCLLRRLKRKMT